MKRTDPNKKKVVFKNGTLFFTEQTQRTLFFILTLIMLFLGAVYKWM